MARAKGPLFSVAASGTFQDLMEFRSGSNRTTIHGIRKTSGARSPAQAAQSARFAAAVTAWKTLDTATKAQWKASAASTGLNAYQLFLSEYQTQNITAPGLPTPP